MFPHAKTALLRIPEKSTLSPDRLQASNHFSQQSFLDASTNEALLKSFEMKYAIEDKTGDRILLMNFSRKEKGSIDSSNIAVENPPPCQKATTLTAVSLSPKIELLSYEGDEEINLKRKSSTVLKPSAVNTIASSRFDSQSQMEGKAVWDPIMDSQIEEEGFQTFHSKITELEKPSDWVNVGCHIRNSSWESFVNLARKRKDMQNQRFQKKKMEENCLVFQSDLQELKLTRIKEKNVEKKERDLPEKDPPPDQNVEYVHIPGYFKDERPEQKFANTQESPTILEKHLILRELYANQPSQPQKKASKDLLLSNKKSPKISQNKQKTQNIDSNSKENYRRSIKNPIKTDSKPAKTTYKPVNIGFYEVARAANSEIELLSKQTRESLR